MLMEKTPVCLACFLVGQGIWGYQGGDYWSSAAKAIGADLDSSIQAKLGRFILQLANRYQLPAFETSVGHQYVTPILFHGGIPQNSLPSFFDNIVIPMVDQDTTSRVEIQWELEYNREQDRRQIELTREFNELKADLDSLKKQETIIEELCRLQARHLELQTLINTLPDPAPFASPCGDHLDELNKQYQQLQTNLNHLEQMRADCHKRINAVTSFDEDIIRFSSFLNDSLQEYIQFARQLHNTDNWAEKADLWRSRTSDPYFRSRRNQILSGLSMVLKQEIAASMDGNQLPDENREMVRLFYLTLQARERLAAREKAQSELTDKIEPDIRSIQEQIRKKKEAIETLSCQLKTLGGGDLKTGIQLVEEARKATVELRQVNDRLRLLRATAELIIDPEASATYSDLLRSVKDDITKTRIRLAECKAEISKYSPSFPYADEPVRRFLLYGGNWAERWLWGAINLVHRSINSNMVVREAAEGLPPRVVDWFVKRFDESSQKSDSAAHQTRSTDLSGPIMALDPVHGELKLIFKPQRIKLSGDGMAKPLQIALEIKAGDLARGWIKRVKAYLNRGVIETAPVDLQLSQLCEYYDVNLRINDVVMRSWRINGPSEDLPVLGFTEEGRRITSRVWPGGRSWLLLLPGYAVAGNVQVIEEMPAIGNSSLLLIDTCGEEELLIRDGSGHQHTLPLQGFTKPQLLGGQLCREITVEGRPVYCKSPDSMLIPLKGANDLSLWEIITLSGKDEDGQFNRYRINELPNTRRSHDSFIIELGVPEIWGACPTGLYRIVLLAPQGVKYRFEIVILPEIDVEFNPPLIMPSNDDEPKLSAVLIVPAQCSFTPSSPAQIASIEDDVHVISTDPTAEQIDGELITRSPETTQALNITIAVPRLMWRIIENNEITDWRNGDEELWIGSWYANPTLVLEISIPLRNANWVLVYTVANGKEYTGTIKDGRIKVDLLTFTEDLSDGESLHFIWIEIFDRKNRLICRGKLFTVRCRWEVENLSLYAEKAGDQWEIHAEWNELGKASSRELRLWRLWEPWNTPTVFNIPEGSGSFSQVVPKINMPSGSYLAQLCQYDPWDAGHDGHSFPTDTETTGLLSLDDGQPYLCGWSLKWGRGGCIVSGRFANPYSKVPVMVYLMGQVEGKPVAWYNRAQTDYNGEFRVFVSEMNYKGNHKLTPSLDTPIHTYTHWIGIVTDETLPTYHFAIIPEPAPLEWPVTMSVVDQHIKPLITVSECFEWRLTASYKNRLVVEQVLGGKQSYSLTKSIEKRREGSFELENGEFKFSGTDLEVAYAFNQGEQVLCTDTRCRRRKQPIPNQDIWHKEHHLKGCRSFKPLREPGTARLFWRWAPRPLITGYHHQYPICNYDYLTLVTSRRPVNPAFKRPLDDLEQLSSLLWEREKKLVLNLQQGRSSIES
ncbi:MAG: hypothetical protein ACOX4Q_10950 [Syntrophomonadales bacterium]